MLPGYRRNRRGQPTNPICYRSQNNIGTFLGIISKQAWIEITKYLKMSLSKFYLEDEFLEEEEIEFLLFENIENFDEIPFILF